MKKKIKLLKIDETLIIKHTEFSLMHYENVERLVLALTLSGYFVRVRRENSSYLIEVYK
jgi:hypothetical protein